MIFETHCHLNDDAFKEDLEETLKRAKENHVTSLCVIGWDKDSSINAVRICKEYKNMGLNLYAAVGLHPENVKDEKDKELNWLIDLINEEEVCAIGEIGIDLHFEKDTLDMQKYFFEKQLKIASDYNKPVIIHMRDAMQITYDIVYKYKNKVKGIFHCYSGSYEMAKNIIDLGYKIGIGGVLTFKNSKLYEVLEKVDIEDIVLETDCPYLSPEPNRGKRNEPAFLIHVVRKIASIKNMSEDDVMNITNQNAKSILEV